jgi:hypothetical protein
MQPTSLAPYFRGFFTNIGTSSAIRWSRSERSRMLRIPANSRDIIEWRSVKVILVAPTRVFQVRNEDSACGSPLNGPPLETSHLFFPSSWLAASPGRLHHLLKGQIRGVIFLIEERLLSAIAAPSDMTGDTRNHNSRQSYHSTSLPAAPHNVNGNPWS